MQIQQYVYQTLDEQRANQDAEDGGASVPEVRIDGTNYQVKGPQKALSTGIGYIQLFLFMYMFIGELMLLPFGGLQAMPDAIKDIHKSIQENKIQFGFSVFFLGLMLQSQLLQSGAFEIYINGNLEFSKLESGLMPTLQDIQTILSKYDVHV